IVSKFADHLPLYRQDNIFEREGVDISRATQTSWLMQIYEAIQPLGDVLKQVVLKDDILFTDDFNGLVIHPKRLHWTENESPP
ncbi:MAG: transposase, partial [Anaerolineae bacterium]